MLYGGCVQVGHRVVSNAEMSRRNAPLQAVTGEDRPSRPSRRLRARRASAVDQTPEEIRANLHRVDSRFHDVGMRPCLNEARPWIAALDARARCEVNRVGKSATCPWVLQHVQGPITMTSLASAHDPSSNVPEGRGARRTGLVVPGAGTNPPRRLTQSGLTCSSQLGPSSARWRTKKRFEEDHNSVENLSITRR